MTSTPSRRQGSDDPPVNGEELKAWLAAYGRAWESRDSSAFARLFAPAVRYHWTPFDPPKEGREAVVAAFEAATARQDRIEFRSRVLGQHGGQALAHWQCSFVRDGSGQTVHLDGIFLMEFNGNRECTLFREWWHSDEARLPE